MFAKTKPIQHGFGDNTEVIQNEAQAIHARYQNIQGPKNMPYGTGASATRGASDEGKAFNGGTVTAPPQEFSG
jgi:hypothetical protein